jgi:hypothetical protein
VKNEGSNLNIMIDVLKLIISCNILDVEENFENTCFGLLSLKFVNMKSLKRMCECV